MTTETNSLKVNGVSVLSPLPPFEVKPLSPATSFPVDIKTITAALVTELKESSTQQIIQTEPGPWAATRSGKTRTQIIAQSTSANSTTTLRTVAASTTLYITTANIRKFGAAASEAVLVITSSADAVISTFCCCGSGKEAYGNVALSFPMPLVVTAGQKVRLVDAAGVSMGIITGWEE
jgi:hypothetical protein